MSIIFSFSKVALGQHSQVAAFPQVLRHHAYLVLHLAFAGVHGQTKRCADGLRPECCRSISCMSHKNAVF